VNRSIPRPRHRAQHVRRWLGLFVATIGFAWFIGALVTPFSPVVSVRWTPNLDAPLQAKTERDLGLVRGIQIVGEDHTWRYQLRSGDADTLARLVNHPAVDDTNGFERSEPRALISESVPLAIPLILSLWVSLVLCRVDFSPRSVGVVAQPAPSHEVLAARPTQLFATHENVKVFALLFVVAMSMVAATYWRVYLNPNPAWPANDDATMFSDLGRFLSGGLSFRDYILTAHSDSLVPLLRVVYWGFASVSSDWPPSWSHFGYAFILITALSIASSGFLVWYFGRNLVVAGSVVALQVSSQAWSSGVVSIFQYSGHYVILTATALSIPLIFRYLQRRVSPVPLGVCMVLSTASFAPGVLLAPILVGFGLCFILGGGGAVVSSRRKIATIASVAVLVILVYVIATALGVVFYGNVAPGDLFYSDRTEWPPVTLAWVVDYYNYSLLGWLWPQAVVIHDQGPFQILQHGRWALLLLTIGIPAAWALRASNSQPDVPTGNPSSVRGQAAVMAAATFCAMAFIGVVLVGRPQGVYWWNLRYCLYNLVFGALLVGVPVSAFMNALPRRWKTPGQLALLSLTWWLFWVQLNTLYTSPEYVRRFLQ